MAIGIVIVIMQFQSFVESRERVGRAAEGIEEAVKMAGGRAIQRFERPTPAKAGEAIKVDFNQPNLGSTKGLIAKALASNDKKKS